MQSFVQMRAHKLSRKYSHNFHLSLMCARCLSQQLTAVVDWYHRPLYIASSRQRECRCCCPLRRSPSINIQLYVIHLTADDSTGSVFAQSLRGSIENWSCDIRVHCFTSFAFYNWCKQKDAIGQLLDIRRRLYEFIAFPSMHPIEKFM